MDAGYLDRLVEAWADLQRRERRADLSFSWLARHVSRLVGREVAPQTVGRWMKGRTEPDSAEDRKALAAALGVDLRWLYYNEGEKVTPTATGQRVAASLGVAPDKETPASELAARLEEQEQRAAKKASGQRPRRR